MTTNAMKRALAHPLALGAASLAFCFAFTWVFWPLWALSAKALIQSSAATGLAMVAPEVADKFARLFAEATFFWIFIVSWIWQSLVFGGYGKNWLTERQPWAGLWYSAVALLTGIGGFLLFIAFPGLWWKPFNLAILMAPSSAHEVELAIQGWEASNFYSLACIVAQASYVALFKKWPFGGKVTAALEGFGTMMTSTVFALLFWLALVVPSLLEISIAGEPAVTPPFGSFAKLTAFCQGFILVCLIPAEGGEQYPGRLFAKSQPGMGLVTFAIALLSGFLLPELMRPLVLALDLLPGAPADVVIASLLLSIIVAMLLWHHLFSDYPSARIVPSAGLRALIRLGIWVSSGLVYGVIWLKAYKLVPWGGNGLGLGVPGAGVLAGQFVFLTLALWFNSFFGKWPLVSSGAQPMAASAPQPA